MNDDGASYDSGFDGVRPFRDTPESGGISLESALRDFGPAALDDLIPRIRALAAVLDAAHAAGAVHGALHPSKVIISGDATSLIAGASSTAPYVAPEVADGEVPSARSDQYSLAAIAYQWLFGRPISGRTVEVRSMPGVDRAALSAAFTRALSANPADRFDSCGDFCNRLADAVVPELPLLAFEAESDAAPEPALGAETTPIDTSFANEIDLAPDFAAVDRGVMELDEPRVEPETATIVDRPVPTAFSAPPPRSSESPRFSGTALILALLVGAIFGFAAGYMAKPRALQTGPAQEMAVAPGTDESVGAGGAGRAGAETATAQPASPASPAPPAKSAPGRLLVRSNPSGASVTVDGVERGVTPLALSDLELGTRRIIVTRRGFNPETRTVAITAERPSRSLDVRLAAAASATAGRSGAAAPKSAPAKTVATGTLVVESRPTGAAVTINGTARGVTPLTIGDLAPGDYRVVMSMKGFVNFVTTVRVVAGERVRAAASLTAQEQE